MTMLVIDRHTLASNASSYDTAWETFGWTPALGGARASRLEEQVPWATFAARAKDPARLAGPADRILAPANFDRLDSAFLPLEGRLGFSIWGAIGERQRRGGEWRVATHTLLFGIDAFEALAGYPQGLLTIPVASTWFRAMVEHERFTVATPLEPIRLRANRETRAAFERARQREVARLRALLAPTPAHTATLEEELAAAYEALARARSDPAVQHVALRAVEDRRTALLVRFAWLTLPLADRAETSFVTAERRTQTPRAMLFGMPEAEWGRLVPPATLLVEDVDLDRVSAGRSAWARSVARPADPQEHGQWIARAAVRGWRIVARDDLANVARTAALRERWRNEDDRLSVARELIDTEAGIARSRGRLRAAGHVAALTVLSRSDGAERLFETFCAHPNAATSLVRAAVRTLRRGDPDSRRSALRLRSLAASGVSPLVDRNELLRLLEGERDLLAELPRDAAAARLLFRAAIELGFQGSAAAEPLIAAAIAGLPDAGDELLAAVASRALDDARGARVVMQATEAALASRPTDVPLTRIAVALLAGAVKREVTTTEAERLLRLLWAERIHGSGSALGEFFEASGDAAVPLLATLLVAPAPLPLFQTIRSLLLECAARGIRTDRIAPLLPSIRAYSPALAAKLEGHTPASPAEAGSR